MLAAGTANSQSWIAAARAHETEKRIRPIGGVGLVITLEGLLRFPATPLCTYPNTLPTNIIR